MFVSDKKHEAKVIHLIPKPSIDSWLVELKNGVPARVVAAVTVYHRLNKKKQKEAENARFTFTLDAKHLKKKSVYHHLELLKNEGTSGLSEKHIGDLIRQSKDALNAFYQEYKRVQ